MAEGKLLPRETDLSEQFGISRQAVREGLKVLAAKGMVSTRRRAGSIVTPRSQWNVFDADVVNWHQPDDIKRDLIGPLAELRLIIEPKAAGLAARRATEKDIQAIRDSYREQQRLRNHVESFAVADAAFHEAVLTASGNTILAQIAHIMEPVLEASLAMHAVIMTPFEDVLKIHGEILEAIEARDPVVANMAMLTHLSSSRQVTARIIGSMENPADYPPPPSPVLYPSAALHGRLAHELGRAIVLGTFAEGTYLPRETELAETHGLSRQAVREALRVLAAKGLVSTRRRAGTIVGRRSNWNLLDPDVIGWLRDGDFPGELIRDLIEFRHILEPEAARLASLRQNPEAIAALAKALSGMRAAEPGSPAYVRADASFHVAILSASGNNLIARLGGILAPMLEAMLGDEARQASASRVGLAEHEAIFDAIVSGDFIRSRDVAIGFVETLVQAQPEELRPPLPG